LAKDEIIGDVVDMPSSGLAAITERPWGWFRTLVRRPDYHVKEIFVRPAAKLSLQRHRYRAEQWTIVNGEALVKVGTREMRLSAGGHIEIPLGEVHRLANAAEGPLYVIEVQMGSYFGEDDIERLADEYGRA
jgi:mannose-6-phosphate isomerase-like protein (cupin superfamily)